MVLADPSTGLTVPSAWRKPIRGEVVVGFAVAVLAAQRLRLPLDIPLGVIVCALVLPVSFGTLRRYRFASLLAVLAVLAVVSGTVLTDLARGWSETSGRMAVANSIQLLGVIVTAMALLWARTVVGTRVMTLGFGIGMLLAVLSRGVNWDNPWKFTFSVPVILIVLSLGSIYGRRRPQIVALLALAALSAVQDSRSLTGMLVVVVALILTQGERVKATSSRAVLVAIRAALVGIAGYFLVQAALLDGVLGEQAQQRSVAQIGQSGSLLVGGRPELGASIALLSSQPWGYGSGVLPSSSQIQVAKSGMRSLGYDPDNGYVTRYMFGNGFEVHSLAGDLWILFGVFGLLFALALAAAVGTGLIVRLAAGSATAVGAFLALRTTWDIAFSPIGSATLTLAVTIALLLPERDPRRATSSRTRFASRRPVPSLAPSRGE